MGTNDELYLPPSSYALQTLEDSHQEKHVPVSSLVLSLTWHRQDFAETCLLQCNLP